jgi:WD40 repeat protein
MLTATNVDAANLSGQVHALAFSNDDSALWGTGPGLGLRCWPLRDQEPFGSIVHVCFAEESRPRSSQSSWLHSTGALAIHPSKPVIALGGDHMAKKIFLLNQATLRVYESVLAHVEGVSALAFDISRNRMISAGNEGTVKFWQLDQM